MFFFYNYFFSTLSDSNPELRFVSGRNVVITVEQNENEVQTHDSAKAKSVNIADYKYDSKNTYNSRILSIREGVLAYRFYNTKIGESVRVMNLETRNRHLIKGFLHAAVDIQWALHATLLAIIDKQANLYVYTIDEKCSSVYVFLFLFIK